MQTPLPVRVFSMKRTDDRGEPADVPLSAELEANARRYAEEWRILFGRYPQGQHPLKFPVNRQISAGEADLILEFPAHPVHRRKSS